MAEGAPLLREYRVKSLIEGSNPSLSATFPSARLRTKVVSLFPRRCARAAASTATMR